MRYLVRMDCIHPRGPKGARSDPFFHNMMKSSIVHCGMLQSFTFPMGSMLWILPFWMLDRVST